MSYVSNTALRIIICTIDLDISLTLRALYENKYLVQYNRQGITKLMRCLDSRKKKKKIFMTVLYEYHTLARSSRAICCSWSECSPPSAGPKLFLADCAAVPLSTTSPSDKLVQLNPGMGGWEPSDSTRRSLETTTLDGLAIALPFSKPTT